MSIEKLCKDCFNTFPQYNSLQKRCPRCSFNRYSKPRKPIKRMGKVAKKWAEYRQQWFEENPPDVGGYYLCGICGIPLHIDDAVLDHIIPRSNRPDLRFKPSNIQPTHWECNSQKGSKH